MNKEQIEAAISALINHVSGSRAIDIEALYDEMLNESYDFSSVGGPFACMEAADVLKEMDECAYNEGRNDYTDARCKDGEWIEIGEEYYDSNEAETEKNNFIFDYAEELRGDEVPEDEIEEIVAALENHTF